jgi:hypothetical protein
LLYLRQPGRWYQQQQQQQQCSASHWVKVWAERLGKAPFSIRTFDLTISWMDERATKLVAPASMVALSCGLMWMLVVWMLVRSSHHTVLGLPLLLMHLLHLLRVVKQVSRQPVSSVDNVRFLCRCQIWHVFVINTVAVQLQRKQIINHCFWKCAHFRERINSLVQRFPFSPLPANQDHDHSLYKKAAALMAHH